MSKQDENTVTLVVEVRVKRWRPSPELQNITVRTPSSAEVVKSFRHPGMLNVDYSAIERRIAALVDEWNDP